MSHDTEGWRKVWRKTDFLVLKMMNLVNFDASSDKSENLHFDVLLLLKVYYVLSHKSTDELCVTTLKNDAKFEEDLTCALKNDMKNLADFIPSLATLKVCALMGPFWSKYIMFERKNYRGIICHDTKGYVIFKQKLTGGLKNDIRNLINFHASIRKSENLHFDELVLSKAYKVLDKKVQKSYVSWHWRLIQRKVNCWEVNSLCDAIDLKQSVEGILKV